MAETQTRTLADLKDLGSAPEGSEPTLLREKKVDGLGRAYATGRRKNAVARVWSKAFWRPREEAPEGHLTAAKPPTLVEDSTDVYYEDRTDPGRMPVLMVLATAGLVTAGLALTVLAGPVLGIAERAAADLDDPSVYIGSVLGSEPR